MDEQLKQLLVTSVNEGKTALYQSVDFLKQQAPDMVEQFLRWSIWGNVFWIVVDALIIAALIFLIKFCSGRIEEGIEEWEIGKWISGVLIVCFVIGFFSCINDLIHVWVAPKHFLYEELIKPVFEKK